MPAGPRHDWESLAQVAWTYAKSTDGGHQALADWVEVLSLSDPSGKCSRADLVRRLRQDLDKDDGSGEKFSQDKASDVFACLSERSDSYWGKGYPFKLDADQDCVLFDSKKKDTLYIFFLVLSYVDPVPVVRGDIGFSGAQLFEQLCVQALNRLFPPAAFQDDSAQTFHLGNPSTTGMPGLFWKKVDFLCARISEGRQNGYRPPDSGKKREAGDDGIDIIHRRGFSDQRGSQFLISASCATGRSDWHDKRGECNPGAWTSEHMLRGVLAQPALSQCCFVPRMVPVDKWEGLSRHAGAVIDRCRLAHILEGVDTDVVKSASRWLWSVVPNGREASRGTAT